MSSSPLDTTLPEGVDPDDRVALEFQVARLSRQAALETIATQNSNRVTFRHPVRSVPDDLARRMFTTFSYDILDHLPFEEIVEHVHRRHTPTERAQGLVASWTRAVLTAEASSMNVALWNRYNYTQSRPPSDVVRRAYVLHATETAAIAVVPRHIIPYFRSGPHRILEDLGKQSPHDTPEVLETTLGLYDPSTTGNLSSGKSALQAARLMHRPQ